MQNNECMFNTFWYSTLLKPPFTPSAELFAPVWIILYVTILISLFIYIFSKTRRDKIKGYICFLIQLILNVVWPYVFFTIENCGLALVIILLLDISVFLTVKEFYKISKYASAILIPYFIWIIFATYLNAGICILNF